MPKLETQLLELKSKAIIDIVEKFYKKPKMLDGERLAIKIDTIETDSSFFNYVTMNSRDEILLYKNSQSAGWNVGIGINDNILLLCKVADRLVR